MNARPKKSFGQHFLHEKRYIDRIVASIAPKDGDTVVEIGPGEGAMTMPLLAVAKKMTASTSGAVLPRWNQSPASNHAS